MIRALVYVLLLVGLTWLQMRFLAPLKTKKEWAVYGSTMALAAVIGVILILNLSVPSPMSGMRGIVEPIGRSILH